MRRRSAAMLYLARVPLRRGWVPRPHPGPHPRLRVQRRALSQARRQAVPARQGLCHRLAWVRVAVSGMRNGRVCLTGIGVLERSAMAIPSSFNDSQFRCKLQGPGFALQPRPVGVSGGGVCAVRGGGPRRAGGQLAGVSRCAHGGAGKRADAGAAGASRCAHSCIASRVAHISWSLSCCALVFPQSLEGTREGAGGARVQGLVLMNVPGAMNQRGMYEHELR